MRERKKENWWVGKERSWTQCRKRMMEPFSVRKKYVEGGESYSQGGVSRTKE